MSKTNLPGFTAEASLYKTSGHYRIHRARQEVSSSAQMISPVYPALFQRPEQIEVHGCPVGWTDFGGTCYPPPLTEPPVGAEGEDLPPGGRPEDGGPYGKGKAYGGKTFDEWLKELGGRYCSDPDIPGTDPERRANAEGNCTKMATKTVDRALACFDNPDGTVSPTCCHLYLKDIGKGRKEIAHVLCIYGGKEVPPK